MDDIEEVISDNEEISDIEDIDKKIGDDDDDDPQGDQDEDDNDITKLDIDKDIDDDNDNDNDELNEDDDYQYDDEDVNNLTSKSKNLYDDSQSYNTDEDENYETDEDDNYLQKLKNKDFILENHRETLSVNYNTINDLCNIIRGENGEIDDPHHRTLPILSKYERTKIIGVRAKQLNNGATPFVNVAEHIIDGLIIAQQELKEKKIPFIIKRPIANSHFEYWKLQDLEVV